MPMSVQYAHHRIIKMLSYPSACLIAQQAQVAFLAVNGDGRFLDVHEFVSIAINKNPRPLQGKGFMRSGD